MEGRLAYKGHVSPVVSEVFGPQPHLGSVAELLGIAGVFEEHTEASVRGRGILLVLRPEQVLRVALGYDLLQSPHVPDSCPEALFQTVAEPLACLPGAGELDCYALFSDLALVFPVFVLPMLLVDTVPGGNGEGELDNE